MNQVSARICNQVIRHDDLIGIDQSSLSKKICRVARVILIGMFAGWMETTDSLLAQIQKRVGFIATIPALLFILPVTLVVGGIFGGILGGGLVKGVLEQRTGTVHKVYRLNLNKIFQDPYLICRTLEKKLPEDFYQKIGKFLQPLKVLYGELNNDDQLLLKKYFTIACLDINGREESSKQEIKLKIFESFVADSKDVVYQNKVRSFIDHMLDVVLRKFPKQFAEKLNVSAELIQTDDDPEVHSSFENSNSPKGSLQAGFQRLSLDQIKNYFTTAAFRETFNQFWYLIQEQ